jgi:hypothetical protein
MKLNENYQMAGKPASIRNVRTLPAANPDNPVSAVASDVSQVEGTQPELTADADPWALAEADTTTSVVSEVAPAPPTSEVASAPTPSTSQTTPIPDYVAELAEQRKRNRELTELVLELNEKIDRLTSANNAATKSQPQTFDIDDKDLELSEEERKIYGESLPVIEKVVKRHLKQLSSQFDSRLNEIVNTTSKNDLAAFINLVQNRVTNARQLTKDPGFIRYLNERVPGTGLTRKQIFDLAHENRDLEAVVSIFEGYKVDTPDATASMRSPSTTAANPQVTAPTRSIQAKKPVFKESDSRKLSEDFRSGKIDLNTYKKRRMLLEEAVREGRIIRGQ